jgi:hypothetical protein
VLFALGDPAAFAGLLIAFLFGIVLRAVAIRITTRWLGLGPRHEPVGFRPRHDIDPFGAVVAALGGTGWGRPIDIDEVPRHRGRGRAAAVFAAGPLSALIVGQLALIVYTLLYPDTGALHVFTPAAVLRGVPGAIGEQLLISFAVGLVCFGLLAIIPVPPLDGFGLLSCAFSRPSPGIAWARLWLGDKNIGVALLLLFALFPAGYPILLMLIDLIGIPFLRIWA